MKRRLDNFVMWFTYFSECMPEWWHDKGFACACRECCSYGDIE